MKKDIETDLISVIVPIFNVEAYLRPCIESILASTYTTLQIILVNDGSTDHSGEICDEYTRKDTRIEVIHQKNAGLSPARNSGMKAAKGKYISFIDGDDYIHPQMYEVLLEALQEGNYSFSMILGKQVYDNIRLYLVQYLFQPFFMLFPFIDNTFQYIKTGFPVIFKIIYVTIYQMYLSGKGEYWFVFIVGHNNPNLIL
jgi:glycosyltransferase involved in cell wall biosynthesis